MKEPDPHIERLKERGWREIAAINKALAEGRIDEEGWHEAMAALVKPAYLSAENPYAQAGHSGNAETWEESRGFIADALDRSGTFLDVGCANGILMESVRWWGRLKNLRIEPYGLDIIPELAELARARLAHWADRIYVGNIRTWIPADKRFDYALVRPEYAPRSRLVELIDHTLDHVMGSDGRLIVFVGAEEAEHRSVEQSIARHGIAVSGHAERPHPRESRLVRRLFWIDGPNRSSVAQQG